MSEAEEKRAEALGVCPWCRHASPEVREGHFDKLFQTGEEEMRAHLKRFWTAEEKLIDIKARVRRRRVRFEELAREARAGFASAEILGEKSQEGN